MNSTYTHKKNSIFIVIELNKIKNDLLTVLPDNLSSQCINVFKVLVCIQQEHFPTQELRNLSQSQLLGWTNSLLEQSNCPGANN